ncbi:30S ribosomal protein S2 [Candidatus Giovannonibacteria bacterium RIFCSPLOWO2_12_FULL_44_25]|uniref:Small ribosomal subunit protein uS2 n=4 Tax=Parcubacteria group TaxID=1794811 RepID=A0A837IHD2_9BACT|nr:MAG: 30S ribosomal protein S2 [Parcubacteria group bacterium GW2011_GWC1_44_10]KKT57076.1 MAG: 30S ribosomal protein S2 [Candidatus Giovannonibacteria bacterium GW2011_GWB1_44_23]KKT59513.1 MAG: 30S ribosomal protein S2 [Candidatus Giovannonibacteria bacterium GW2011_GWA1_44_25]KKU13047.1 MAG: 30S ribosomal protein S2 [Candidatus Azambacteria bacterium GW2011_GWC2_45_7b]OGF49960.1 MAG: 30S ribosomal protein S2 [Candidatus Giovannonibacteria bacterium GWA2_45_15]OGF60594.1 MAG: 30S ribosomal
MNIEELFEAGAHIGYSKARRNPKMQEYIFSTRNNVEIFDLGKTLAKIKEAEDFLTALGQEKKNILWVGTKPPAGAHVAEVGAKTNTPYVAERWLGGTLTNFKILEGRLSYWASLESEEKSGGFDKYPKKERLIKMTELKKLARMFTGLRNLKAMPGALVIVDSGEERTALAEAKKKGIPVVALLNVDCNPAGIAHPIPMNDNSSAAIALVLKQLAAAYDGGAKTVAQDKIQNNGNN